MAVAVEAARDDHHDPHGGRAQGRGGGARQQRVTGHRPCGNRWRGRGGEATNRLLDNPREQADLQAGDHDDMDESAGNHLLLQRGRQRGTVAEDDAQQQGRLRFRQGPVDGIDDGVPQPEQCGAERVAAARSHAHQASARHHAGDALLREVGPIIELVEAWRLLDFARQQHQVSVLQRRHAVDGRLDPKRHPGLFGAGDDVIDAHG